MDHHMKRLEHFKNDEMKTGEIIFLGNSITEGADWAALTGKTNTLNRGIGGDITFGLLQRTDELIERKPAKIFVMIGINDIGKDIPPQVISSNVSKLIRKIRSGSPSTEIIIQSILPVNPEYPGFPQHYDKQNQVLITNQLIEKAAREQEIRYVNLYPYFLDDRLRLNQELTTDGLHLNSRGYERWVELLKEWELF